jgi:hypothetical protein
VGGLERSLGRLASCLDAQRRAPPIEPRFPWDIDARAGRSPRDGMRPGRASIERPRRRIPRLLVELHSALGEDGLACFAGRFCSSAHHRFHVAPNNACRFVRLLPRSSIPKAAPFQRVPRFGPANATRASIRRGNFERGVLFDRTRLPDGDTGPSGSQAETVSPSGSADSPIFPGQSETDRSGRLCAPSPAGYPDYALNPRSAVVSVRFAEPKRSPHDRSSRAHGRRIHQ